VPALDHDAVRVLEILLEVGRAAAPERGPQTGNGRAVSYPRLVFDLDRPHRGEQLLDQIVLLVVERRAAEVREPQRAVHAPAVSVGVLPAALARRYDPFGDHVHRALELQLLPLGAPRPTVF